MERVVNFPRLWESEFVGDGGEYFRDGEWSFPFSGKFRVWKGTFEVASF